MSVTAPLSQRHDAIVFFNGKYVAGDEARVGVMTHALSYGTGCFEGIRGYWNPEQGELFIFRVREHFERLHRSCRIVNLKLPYTVDELVEIAVQLVRRNGYRENVYLRPFAFKADEMIGVRLHDLRDEFTMYCVPLGDYVSTSGLRCGVSSWRRVDDNMIPARAKISGAYVNSAFAKTEAQQNGFDEAIMLTSEGHVSEGSAENLFMVVNGELITPPATENILLGITRDTVIELARRELEMLTRERVVDRTELYCADEILLTGTGAQLAPVVEVDHRLIGTGTVGPVASALQRIYGDVVRGRLPQYRSWCHPAYAGAVVSAQASAPATPNGNGRAPHATPATAGHKNSHATRRPAASGATQTRKA
ncbi:MAG TPA: branched-chain amino acid transaminase [Ktedonobacterales bacterium]|nr:branched-chain amino acid transaminase [Ktedonobacterales bacterium]